MPESSSIDNIGIRKLILQREAHYVKIAERVARFERIERKPVLAELFFKITPRRIRALTPAVIKRVHRVGKNFYAEV